MNTMVQAGKEVTKGTAVVATKKILGKMSFKPDRKPVIPQDDLGLRAGGYRAEIDSMLMENALNIERAYYEVLPMLFSMGLKGGITPTEKNVGQGDYQWPFAPSLLPSVSNAQDAFTFEFGDEIQAFEAEYCLAKTIKISGQVDQAGGDSPVKIETEIFGRQNTKTTFTPALTLPVVTELNAKLARLYVNTSWGTVGTTEKPNILRAFDITIDTGLYPRFNGSENKYFGTHGEGEIGIVATLTIENGVHAIDLLDAIGTMKIFRVSIPGPVIGTTGVNTLDIDFSAIVQEPIPGASYDKATGLATIALEGIYDPTGSKLLDVNVTTSVQTAA